MEEVKSFRTEKKMNFAERKLFRRLLLGRRGVSKPVNVVGDMD